MSLLTEALSSIRNSEKYRNSDALRKIIEYTKTGELEFIDPVQLPLPTIRPTSNTLIITVAVGDEGAAMHAITGPSQGRYAAKCGADYFVVSGQSVCPKWTMYDKFRCHQFMQKYDRTLYVDADVLISKKCPSLFDLYPEEVIMMHDDTGYQKEYWNYMHEVREVSDSQGLGIPPEYRLLNSGVVLLSKIHAHIWEPPAFRIPKFWCSEQHLETIRVLNGRLPWCPLPRAFNWMWWINQNHPDPSPRPYIIHAAGYTGFGGSPTGRMEWLIDRREEDEQDLPFLSLRRDNYSPKHTDKPIPSFSNRARNYIATLSEHLANGSRMVPLAVRQERWKHCEPCEHRNRQLNACSLCGCTLSEGSLLGDKLSWEVSNCADSPKRWGTWLEDRPATGSGWEVAPDAWTRFNKMIAREKQRLLAEPLPTGEGNGIVIAGGGRYFPSAYANVRLIRHHGCQLPIELWYLGRDNEMPEEWRKIIEPYGVTCIDADEVNKRNLIRILNGWELKIFAAAHNRFRKFISLDSDCFPMRDPTFVLSDPRFLGAGAVFQRDCAGFEWIKPGVVELFNIPTQPVWDLESGAFSIDKKRWGLALGMTLFLNSYSDLVYKVVYGDKTTPALASLITGQPYAIPMHQPGGGDWGLMQKWFDGSDMWQHRIHLKPSLKEELFVSPQHKSPKLMRQVTQEMPWGPEITAYLTELRKLI